MRSWWSAGWVFTLGAFCWPQRGHFPSRESCCFCWWALGPLRLQRFNGVPWPNHIELEVDEDGYLWRRKRPPQP